MTAATIRLTGARRFVARKMRQSLEATAQLTFHAEARAQEMLERREALAAQGGRVSLEDLLLEALGEVLARHPHCNGVWKDDEVILRPTADIAVAVAAPGGLVTPTLFDVGALTLNEIAGQRRELVARALTGRITVKEQTGGSFTLSNLGRSRVQQFTPILNYPQIALLGVGCLYERCLPGPAGCVAIPHLGLSLTVDHAVIDGAPAAALLTELCEVLERTP